jgi:hypothetical protein
MPVSIKEHLVRLQHVGTDRKGATVRQLDMAT